MLVDSHIRCISGDESAKLATATVVIVVTMVNPFETKMAFLAHISNFITISHWENSWGDPLRTQF
jgi:hypothetical protein